MNASPVKIWRRQQDIRSLLRKKGKVLTWTYIFTPPVGHKKNAPYPVILVEFTSGQRAFGQLVDCDKEHITIGMSVVSTLRKVREGGTEDVISYGLKFIPA